MGQYLGREVERGEYHVVPACLDQVCDISFGLLGTVDIADSENPVVGKS